MNQYPGIPEGRPGATQRVNPPVQARHALNVLGFLSWATALLTIVNLERHGNCDVGTTESFRYFQEDSELFDVVFVGSSYTAHQVDPGIFDDQCAKRGVRIRSINLAVVGSTFYKIDDHLRRILAESPRNLRYVIMDPRPAEGLFRENEVGSSGAIRWHTPLQTYRVLRRVWSMDAPIGRKIRSTHLHLRHFLQNFSHVGCGRRMVAGILAPGPEPSEKLFDYAQGTEDFRGDCEEWIARTLSEYESLDSERCADQFDLEALDAQMQLLSDHGVLPVFVATPSLSNVNLGIRHLAAMNRIPLVLRMDDPQTDPVMFESRFRNRFDCNHIARSRRVVEHYSRRLADRFIDAVISANSPPLPRPGRENT
jgi:hypothetical protein